MQLDVFTLVPHAFAWLTEQRPVASVLGGELDLRIDGVRWINPGSVGMPYEGDVAAFWAVLGPDVEMRRTTFDVERSIEALLASGWPDANAFIEENLRAAVPRAEVVTLFEQIAHERGER